MENFCPRHKTLKLQYLYDEEIDNSFGCGGLTYCPALECDYVKLGALGLEPGPLDVKKNELLFMTVARQKTFFKKFAEQFICDGK